MNYINIRINIMIIIYYYHRFDNVCKIYPHYYVKYMLIKLQNTLKLNIQNKIIKLII